MIVTFCGHSQIYYAEKLTCKILDILNAEIKDETVDFYLGGYGQFDNIAKKSCESFQMTHPNAKHYFVTPYIDNEYLSGRKNIIDTYDGSIYPDIENTPKRYAILQRNKWMVRQADLLIAFINYSWGGAVKTLEYAHKIKKRYINLGTYSPAPK